MRGAVNRKSLRAGPPSRQNRLCCPASPRSRVRTIFCGAETAVPITCAARPCCLRIASVRSAATLVKHPEPRTIVRGENHVRSRR